MIDEITQIDEMPKLTLIDLFAVVTVVALVLEWWLDHVPSPSAMMVGVTDWLW